MNIKKLIAASIERDFLEYQNLWLKDQARFKLGLWARQTGKDYTCAAEAVFDCVLNPKTHWLILACGERQARESLEKAKEWSLALLASASDPSFSGGTSSGSPTSFSRGAITPTQTRMRAITYTPNPRNPHNPAQTPSLITAPLITAPLITDHSPSFPSFPSAFPKITRQSKTEIRFSNGSRITALPAKPATVRGYSANLILTEFAFHDEPEAIWKAIFPSISNPLRGGPKKLRIISTPNGQGNYFHELWTNSKIFSRHKITIHDAVTQKLPIDIAGLKAGLLDPEAWAQEYECEFADQTSVLLPYELIEQCEAPEATETSHIDSLSRSITGNARPDLYLGIDFGRKQDLTVCWVLEKLPPNPNLNPNLNLSSPSSFSKLETGNSKLQPSSSPSALSALNKTFLTREVLVLRRTPTPAQIEALRPRVQLARKVCLDYTGAGIGLGDALRQEFGAKIELCTFTAALKEEIFVKLRAALERRSVFIPKTTEIREDLHSLHRIISHTGQISYRASRTADGHSDRSTALALAVRAAESGPVSCAPSSVGRRNEFLASRRGFYGRRGYY